MGGGVSVVPSGSFGVRKAEILRGEGGPRRAAVRCRCAGALRGAAGPGELGDGGGAAAGTPPPLYPRVPESPGGVPAVPGRLRTFSTTEMDSSRRAGNGRVDMGGWIWGL